MARYLPLICLALAHTLVDSCAQLVEPLWPRLQETFSLLGVASLAGAFVVQTIPASLSQAVFGYLRDRRNTAYLLWLGPLLAAVCITAIGLADGKAMLCLLLIGGGIGIGAFHPEAAVAASAAVPEHRTRALSLFMFGGALGLSLGPTLSGAVVGAWGLRGLLVLLPLMLVLIALLWRLGRLGSLITHTPQAPVHTASGGALFDGQGRLALAIFLICSIRLVPNMGAGKVLAFALADRGYGELEIGLSQSLFLAAASAGMIVMAFRFRSGMEKAFMIWCPLLGIPLLGILGWSGCPPWLFVVSLVLAGTTLWGTTPAMVSYAQQQFPRRAGMASAITMGLAWGLGGLIQAPITAGFYEAGNPQAAFHAFIPCLLIASVGAWLLPPLRSKEQSTADPLSALPAAAKPN